MFNYSKNKTKYIYEYIIFKFLSIQLDILLKIIIVYSLRIL